MQKMAGASAIAGELVRPDSCLVHEQAGLLIAQSPCVKTEGSMSRHYVGHNKTFVFKLYASHRNERLHRLINIAGLVRNHCIALHRRYYRLFGKRIRKYELCHHLVKLKHSKSFGFIKELDAQAVDDVVWRIDKAYERCFRNRKRGERASLPRFRRVTMNKSFTLRQAGWKLDEERGKIKLMKQWYGYFQSRRINGKVKQITVKRDNVGDIYIYVCCEVQGSTVPLKQGKSVGYDFGLKRFLTASDGNDIDSPRFFDQNAKRIKNKHRRLSRKNRASRNHDRARIDLARAYRRIVNLRKDFHYKTSRKICEEYALVCLETLNITALRKIWGRRINDLCFFSFVQILRYEAEKFGTRIAFVPRLFPSTQLCSSCGYKNPAAKNLSVREWDCPECGAHHDRDRNAAVNILRGGASSLAGGEQDLSNQASPLIAQSGIEPGYAKF